MTLKSIMKQRFTPTAHLVVEGAAGVHGSAAWLDNNDLRPLALKDRTWGVWTYSIFWFSASATVANWYAASAAQALGLNMWESLACSTGGQVLIAVVIAANGRPGAVYRVGFPILNRAAFGVFGAWWPTLNRAVMSIVWNGVNAVQGAQCVYTMLHALSPRIATIPNVMGSDSALTSGGMIGLAIFWFATCLLLIIPVPRMKWLVFTKLGVYGASAIAMLAWSLTLAGGIGPVARQSSTVSGSAKGWLIVRFFFLGMANAATFASNAADFQRYAEKPSDVLWGNLIGFPLSNFLVALVGNIVGSSSEAIYGEVIWNPLTFLDMIQTTNYTAANRCGCFLIALMFAYCAILSSILENSIPGGNDVAALLPRYITIKRGMYIVQIVSVAINPWYLLGSASIFITFLASYQIFLSSITGVLLCNYYIISRGRLQIEDLYHGRKQGVYYYTYGWNIRAYVAYLLGVAPNFYGFLDNLGVVAPLGVKRFYFVAYPVGIFISGGAFWACNYFFPPALSFPLNKWLEPKNYIRPEEDQDNVQGTIFTEESDTREGQYMNTGSKGNHVAETERVYE